MDIITVTRGHNSVLVISVTKNGCVFRCVELVGVRVSIAPL